MHNNRVRPLNLPATEQHSQLHKPVIYWMSRDQRSADNWALLHAQELALQSQSPLVVVFCLTPQFLGATARQYDFMLSGLAEVATALNAKHIPFHLLTSENPPKAVAEFVHKHTVQAVVCDFSPLKVARGWKESLAELLEEQDDVSLYEVDTHNIVPAWLASPKQEYAARTFRPKIHKLLDVFLAQIPELQPHPHIAPSELQAKIDWKAVRSSLSCDESVTKVSWITSGQGAARAALAEFIDTRLATYATDRNDPTRNGQSNLSPYLHFGQLSAHRVALEVQKTPHDSTAFLEELIVRRELTDNFCLYNQQYDSLDGAPAWAQATLQKHLTDPREYTYTLKELETGNTHEPLWNAAQQEMVQTGKMHGYLRMYWAKKILEWSKTPQEAIKTAIYLNDRYQLDGRDPNGYVGILWSIAGLHDRPWFERPIFGTIRYMSASGAARKFPVDTYIRRFTQLGQLGIQDL